MARRRRRNVSRATWVIAGSAVAIIGATVAYFLLRDRKRKPLPTEVVTPTADACPPGKHVGGDSDYMWPREDLFLDETGFGEALETFGYDVGDWSAPGWDVCEPDVRQQVEHFQHDYNLVRKTIDEPATDELRTDGLIDDPTVQAMAYVDGLQQAELSWPLVVKETRTAGVT